MKIPAAAIAITILAIGPVHAGSVWSLPNPAPQLVSQSNADWSGFYLGGFGTYDKGNVDTFLPLNHSPLSTITIEGSLYGGFAGYNFQRGNLVFGGELAYGQGEVSETSLLGPSSRIESMVDAKFRLGYALNRVMLYGVVGGSVGFNTHQEQGQPVHEVDFSGMNYGVGVEMKLGNHMFVGLEYLVRESSGEKPFHSFPLEFEYHVETVQARIGWNF